ncbi:MAG: hypothetical protein AB1730_01070 [Myxococcota bacterium]
MRALRLGWLVVIPVGLVATWSACGGTTVDGGIDPTGGEVCLPDRKVCFVVPPGGLADYESFRIAPTSDVPAGALSPGYDISPTRSTRVTFLKPARVVFSLELVNQESVPNENLLRLYTLEANDAGEGWQPLAASFVDRVRNEISGEVQHLSPFVVLRSDRLPDGGIPEEKDGGMKEDSGIIVIPPIPDAGRDAGPPDAGRTDAGPPDAGPPDAGPPDAGVDAGIDAGVDAGIDAGVDAGIDAGVDAGIDAGVDAGIDAGVDAGIDAGVDAGIDAGVDAGIDAGVDAGDPDAGADGG